jgi:uncharacterized protein YjiS (DUF1127 family)
MSTVSIRCGSSGGSLQVLGSALKRWCAVCIAWRIERAAIKHLRWMSDRELEDIGLVRSAHGAVSLRKRAPIAWHMM